MKQGLPGIKWIAWKRCEQLPSMIMLKAMAHVSFNIVSNWTVIELIGKAQIDVQETNDANSQIEQVSLSFRTLDDIPTHSNLAFIVKTVNGESYVIGQKEKPFPEIKVKKSSGSPGGSENVHDYEVTYTARKALIPLSI